jgi:accessory colonization factor AcfC
VASAGEIMVLCPRGVQHAVAAAAEDFQRETRHRVWLSYGTADAIAERAPKEDFDVVINNAVGLMELETRGALRPGTRVMLGRVGTGQYVVLYAAGVLRRSGAPDVAQAFLTHLKSASARAHFEAGGIEPPK